MNFNYDCKIEGCGRESVNASGYCKKHIKAWLKEPFHTEETPLPRSIWCKEKNRPIPNALALLTDAVIDEGEGYSAQTVIDLRDNLIASRHETQEVAALCVRFCTALRELGIWKDL
jgi:hypothetical protein